MMKILHCLRKTTWNDIKQDKWYGQDSVDRNGFIHCSSIEHFWRVAPHFTKIEEEFVLLCIDTNKVNAEIKWEEFSHTGRFYPHIYGQLNLDSISIVLPFTKDVRGNFKLNHELEALL